MNYYPKLTRELEQQMLYRKAAYEQRFSGHLLTRRTVRELVHTIG